MYYTYSSFTLSVLFQKDLISMKSEYLVDEIKCIITMSSPDTVFSWCFCNSKIFSNSLMIVKVLSKSQQIVKKVRFSILK